MALQHQKTLDTAAKYQGLSNTLCMIMFMHIRQAIRGRKT
jgi:hypothetical protein